MMLEACYLFKQVNEFLVATVEMLSNTSKKKYFIRPGYSEEKMYFLWWVALPISTTNEKFKNKYKKNIFFPDHVFN